MFSRIRNTCLFYFSKKAAIITEYNIRGSGTQLSNKYKVVDLFCGAGGLSLGFQQEGVFSIVAAVENNQDARATYLKNYPDKELVRHFPSDVRDVNFSELNSEVQGIDVVIGGPPCQGFSNANRQKNHVVSMNNQLVKEYLRAVREIRPKAFVMENVSMLRSSTHRFFDSNKDHDQVVSFNVPMSDDEIFISDDESKFHELEKIGNHPGELASYQISKRLYQMLNVIRKKPNDEKRVHYLIGKKTALLREFDEDKSLLNERLISLKNNIFQMKFDKTFKEHLEEVLGFQKSLITFSELFDNEIKYTLAIADHKLVAQVRTYSVLDYITKILGAEYRIQPEVYEATRFGVPQRRKRFLLIGVRSNILAEGEELDIAPLIEHTAAYVPTVRDAIEDLQHVQPVTNVDDPPVYQGKVQKSKYAQSLADPEENRIFNHIVPKTTERAMKRFKAISEGKNFHSLPESMKSTYAVPERTQNTIYLRVKYDDQSGTVVNVRKSMWIHPTQNRAISVREAARLQSFPDSYHFFGSKDAQYQQVGNAVPPLMAKGVATFIAELLNNI